MPLDPELASYLESTRNQPPRSSLSIEETRQAYRRSSAALGGPPEPVEQVEELAEAALRMRCYVPRGAPLDSAVVYLHGGRFISGDLETHDAVCRSLAARAECRMIAVDYRLAPEHRFPAALDDAVAAVAWARRNFERVAVAGDSAGAHLALGAALAHRSHLCATVLVYPMLDPHCAAPSHAEFAEGYGPGSVDMQRGWSEYLPDARDRNHPRVKFEDLRDLPPTFLLTAELDTLRDEGEALGARMREAGVDVALKRYHGAIHGFWQMAGISRIAREALDDAARFLKQSMLCAEQ